MGGWYASGGKVSERTTGRWAALLALGLSGCMAASHEVPAPGEQSESAAREVDLVRTDSALRGTVRSAHGELTFESLRTEELRAELSMTINGKQFSWINDDARKFQSSTGHDAVLDASDRSLLRELIQELEPYLERVDEPQPQDIFALIAASYWMESPEGYVHAERSIRTEGASIRKSLGDESLNSGIVCVAQGTAWTLPYTLSNGSVQCDTVTVGADWGPNVCNSGDYACMGRCGAGCGGMGGGWTMDCLEHDLCSHNQCASGGGSDANCGDEYDDAYDDFTAHMWGGGRCSSGSTSDVTPGTDPVCGGGGGGGGGGAVCGNGVVESGESCDGGECCQANCTFAADGAACSGGGSCQAGSCEPPASGGGSSDSIDETNLSGGAGTELFFELIVPDGATGVQFVMSGGTGDADLYVKKGSQVSSSSYDCRPYQSGNNESCTGSGAGHYYVLVRGYSAFSGVSLQGTYTAASGGGGGGGTVVALNQSSLSASSGQSLNFSFVVPAGGTNVVITMSGGTGDGDLYVKKDSAVSTSSYDCRPYKSGNNESCTGSGAGTYNILVRAYSSFSGVSLVGSYTAP